MNFYTDSFIFKLLSFFVRHLISSSLQKEEVGIINSEKNIVYALATESLIDFAPHATRYSRFGLIKALLKPFKGSEGGFF